MVIYLTRHGETDWNVDKKVQGRANIPLNQNGIEQAKITINKISALPIDLILTSPLLRATQTAEIINEKLKVPIMVDDRLSERDFGEFEGLNIKDFNFEHFWNFELNEIYSRAENIRVFFDRIYLALDNIKSEYRDKNILIVSHGGVSIPINCYFNQLGSKDNLLSLVIHNCEVVKYDF